MKTESVPNLVSIVPNQHIRASGNSLFKTFLVHENKTLHGKTEKKNSLNDTKLAAVLKNVTELLSRLSLSTKDKNAILDVFKKTDSNRHHDNDLEAMLAVLQMMVQSVQAGKIIQQISLKSNDKSLLQAISSLKNSFNHLMEQNNESQIQAKKMLTKLFAVIDEKLNIKTSTKEPQVVKDETAANVGGQNNVQVKIENKQNGIKVVQDTSSLLSQGLGLSEDTIKAFLAFFHMIKNLSEDGSNKALLSKAMQTIVQYQDDPKILKMLPVQIQDAFKQLLQNSSLPSGQAINLALLALLENSDSTLLSKMKDTMRSKLSTNLKDGLSQLAQQNNQALEKSNEVLAKLVVVTNRSPLENGSTAHTALELNQREYLLTAYNRSLSSVGNKTNMAQPEKKQSSTENLVSPTTLLDANSKIGQDKVQQIAPLVMSKTQQFVLFVTQAQNQSSSDQESFIRNFQSILAKSHLNLTNGTTKLLIKLYPEHLGSLQIELIQQDDALIAKILTTTANAKDLLESQLQSLKHTFQVQNIPVARIDISSQAQQSFDPPLYQEHHQQQQKQQQQPRQQENNRSTESDLGISTFEEELLNYQV